MHTNEIEISVDVKIEAGIHFWVDKDEWSKMTDDVKKAAISEQLYAAANRASNDVFDYPSGTISASIYGPNDDELNLEEITIYDPNEGVED